MEAFIDSYGSAGQFAYGRPALIADESKEAFYSTNINFNSQIHNITTKNKAESLYQALEIFLEQQPSYENLISKSCFPSFSQETKQSKYQMRKLEELYFFERYFAANCIEFCRNFKSVIGASFSAELRSRRCSEEPDVFAYRFCKALINSGLDCEKLRRTYKQNFQYTLSGDVLLSKGIITSDQRDKSDEVIRFCNEKLQNFFVQM